MPELPEVETVVRDLRPEITGRTIMSVTLSRESVVRFPDAASFVRGLTGTRVEAVDRRGKYILIAVASPTPRRGAGGRAADVELVVHLGMTGHLEISAPAAASRPHTHLRCLLDDGRELRFADARRFGRLLLGPRELLIANRVVPRLGVEPLSEGFTAEAFAAAVRGTQRSLKAVLLDQTRIAGLGNIYVDEACFVAGVRPTRRCSRLTRAERVRLHAAIGEVLTTAIGNRGSSIDDYRDLWNAKGSNQERLLVYGRDGQPCLRCGTPIRRTVHAGRGTAYCPSCQR